MTTHQPNLEERICDLARRTLAVAIVAEEVRCAFRDFAGVYKDSRLLLKMLESELELLFAYVDDAKDEARDLCSAFYAEGAAS